MTINFNLCFCIVNATVFVKDTHFQLLWLLYVAYITTFFASLFGNSVIIHIIRTNNSMKTTTNYLILNQACADLMITIAEGLNVIHYSLMDNSWLGGFLGLITCKIFLTVLFSSHMFSLCVLATIALERFYAVTQPLRSSPVSQHLKKIIFLLWALCLATPSNFLQNASFKKLNDCYYCDLADVLQEWTIINIITGGLLAFLPFFDNSNPLHKGVSQTLVASSARRGIQSKRTTSWGCKNGEKSYLDDDFCCYFISSVLASYVYISYSGVYKLFAAKRKPPFICSLVNIYLQCTQPLRLSHF